MIGVVGVVDYPELLYRMVSLWFGWLRWLGWLTILNYSIEW